MIITSQALKPNTKPKVGVAPSLEQLFTDYISETRIHIPELPIAEFPTMDNCYVVDHRSEGGV